MILCHSLIEKLHILQIQKSIHEPDADRRIKLKIFNFQPKKYTKNMDCEKICKFG